MGQLITIALFTSLGLATTSVAGDHAANSDYDALVKSLSVAGNPYTPEKRFAREGLAKAGQNAVPALLKGFGTATLKGQSEIVRLLGQVEGNDDEMVGQLAGMWRPDLDPRIRRGLMAAISRRHGALAIRELKKLAENDSDEKVRGQAIHSVAHLSSADESAFFRKRTQDVSAYVRLCAYYELALLEDPSGRSLALQTLKGHPESELNRVALDVLGHAGTAEDLPFLKSLADPKDADYSIALSAYYHLSLLQLPRKERLDYLLKAVDDPQKSWWAGTELYDCPAADTNARLKALLDSPGHHATEAYAALDGRRKDEWRPYHVAW